VYSYSTDNRAWAEVCAPVVRRYDGVVGGFGVHQVSSGLYVSSSDHVSLSLTRFQDLCHVCFSRTASS
jgi:hypothetical protein